MTAGEVAVPTGRVPVRDRQRMSGTTAAALRLVAGALLLWLLLVGVGYLFTHQLRNGGLMRWDDSVERWFAGHRTSGWNRVTKATTYAAETETVTGIALIFFVALRLRLGRWRESLFLALAVAGEVTIFVATTLLVDRHRPAVPKLDGAPPTSSFPSGHTAASVALYGGLAIIAWHAARAAWVRTMATVLAVVMPLAVGFCRMYRGMHHPTDVLAGALLGCCWLAVTASVLLAGAARRGVR